MAVSFKQSIVCIIPVPPCAILINSSIIVLININVINPDLLFSHLPLFLLQSSCSVSLPSPSLLPQGLIPDAESYGMIIRSCGHRDLLVEGLKMLEEVTEKGTSGPSVKMLFVRIRKNCSWNWESDGVTEGERGIRWSHKRGEGNQMNLQKGRGGSDGVTKGERGR